MSHPSRMNKNDYWCFYYIDKSLNNHTERKKQTLEEYLLEYLCLDKILGNINSYIMSESIFFLPDVEGNFKGKAVVRPWQTTCEYVKMIRMSHQCRMRKGCQKLMQQLSNGCTWNINFIPPFITRENRF